MKVNNKKSLPLRLLLITFINNVTAEIPLDSINSDIEAANTGQLSFQVDHSLDDGHTFSNRGNLLIHSLRSGSASMDTSMVDEDESFVSQDQKDTLRKLCDNDGLYLLRLIGQDGSIHRTATHSCNLVKSGNGIPFWNLKTVMLLKKISIAIC